MLLSYLPKRMKSYIAINIYKSCAPNIWILFNTHNPLIYQLNGTIKYLPDINISIKWNN